jgi:ribose 5-phosphate isomerase B
MKQGLGQDLRALGHEVLDLGTDDPSKPDDYPDFAEAVGSTLLAKKADRGIIICGSGVGVCVAVNKFPGIRAGVCHDTYSARQGVEHDDMNVLCLGQRVVGMEVARDVVRSFVAAKFSGEERHMRRLEKVKAIEKRFLK